MILRIGARAVRDGVRCPEIHCESKLQEPAHLANDIIFFHLKKYAEINAFAMSPHSNSRN